VALSGEVMQPYLNLDFEALGAAGAWTSSAADFARLLSALRGQGSASVLKAESITQLLNAPTAESGASYYGLGSNVRRFDGNRYSFWHHGSLPGTSSVGISYPNGWNVVAIFNARTATTEARAQTSQDLDRTISQAVAKVRAAGSAEVKP
jgi:CubicO group peptidase (beta-lactamase class C family)